jgi:hypothetical protein
MAVAPYILIIEKLQPTSGMDSIVASIREQCNVGQLGGRIHVLDDMRTCIVYDVAYLPGHLLDKLSQVSHVEVLAESTSLSGFVVRVTLRPSRARRVVTTAAVLACMCAVVVQCVRRDI